MLCRCLQRSYELSFEALEICYDGALDFHWKLLHVLYEMIIELLELHRIIKSFIGWALQSDKIFELLGPCRVNKSMSFLGPTV